MKKVSCLFIIIIILFSNNIFSQTQELYQHFQLHPASLLSEIERSSNQEIKLGNVHLSARFVPNDLLSEQVKKESPGILTYDLLDEKGHLFGNAVISTNSVWINYWDNNRLRVITPDLDSEDPYDHYIDNGEVKSNYACEYEEVLKGVEPARLNVSEIASLRGNMRNGDILRTYRMVIVCTGEFYRLNGDNNSDVNGVIVSSVAGINAIYQREMSIKFTIVGKKMYDDKNTDPFDPNGASRPVQAGNVVASNFSINNYDIGHVLHKSAANDGWGSGGVARLSSACKDFMQEGSPSKGQGWSGSFNNSNFSWFSLFGHEVGHMFSAEHTFNGTGESCTDAISETNAYEIGSGTTIMSYNGICDAAQNIPNNGEADNYFHIASLLQMTNHAETIGNCASTTTTNNSIPDITANPCGTVVVIPKSTPFVLKGDGLDDDGDEIYYSWEQFDEDGPDMDTQGRIGSAASNHPKAPLFKCIPPSIGQYERYFPDLINLSNGNGFDKFQALSSRARILHFKLVGRDFLSDGGAYGFDDLEVEVLDVGPLTLTQPNIGESYAAGEMVEIIWDPKGSEDLCDKAFIKLSVNGGVSYGLTLLEDVDYDAGTAMVEIPAFLTDTDQARIMISCDDSDCAKFFDISNGNFDITSNCYAPGNYICPSEDLIFDQGDPGLDLNLSFTAGEIANELIRFKDQSATKIVVFDTDGASCKTLISDTAGDEFISVSESGTYFINVDRSYQSGFGFVSIFENDTYSNANPCPSFISSSGTWAGTGSSVYAGSIMTAELEACHEYRILFYNYVGSRTRISSISGPGEALIIDVDGNPDYEYGYLAINNNNDVVVDFNTDANFTSLPGGSYTIYGVQFDTTGANPTDMNDYIGQVFFDFYQEGDCFRACDNPFNLEVESICKIESVVVSTASNCNPDDNTFIQSIVLTYSEKPTTGEIMANGQSFVITDSPQTIEYISQSNGEEETVDVFFTEEPGCVYSVNFLQKMNCCTFDVPLSGTLTICENDETILDAGIGGENGGTYQWFDIDDIEIMNPGNELTVSEAGVYTVHVTNATGCTKIESIEVIVSPIPTLNVPTDFTICENDVTDIITTTDAVLIKWYKDGVELVGETFATLTISDGGQYIINGKNLADCEISDTIIVTLTNAPAVDLGDDKTACIGNEEVFNAPLGNNFTYEWFNDGVLFSSSQTITISENVTLGLAVTDENMCRGYDEIIVSFEPGPTLSIDKQMIQFCEGEEEIVTATTDASSIIWLKDNVPIPGATNLSITITEQGIYTAHVEGSSGCEVEKIATVFVHPNPTLDLPDNAIGCQGEPVTLEAGVTATEYIWMNPSGDEISTSNTASANTAGTYSLTIKNEFDCSATDNIEVEFTTRPSITLPATLDVCEGTTKQLTAISDGLSFVWERNGQEITGETEKILDVSESGTYTLIAYNGSDCFDEASTDVTLRTAPIVEIGDNYELCPGDEITLDASNTGATFSWSTGETSQTINITHPDNISSETTLNIAVDVTNQYNCTTMDLTSVLLYPNINAEIDGEMGVCPGDTISLTASGGQLFNWTGTNMSSTTGETIQVFPSETTTYSVEVTDLQCSGQKESASFEVAVYEPGNVSAGEDKTLILGRDVQLEGTGGSTYIWSPESFIVEGQGTANPTVNPVVETMFYVTITDFHGCEQFDSVLVTIIEDPLSLLKHVTIITPNDDGMNDELEFIGLESFASNTLVIYNRWGIVVFEAKDYQLNGTLFDGTRNNEELPADTYFYVLKFEDYVIKESLTIVRPK